MIHLRFKRMHFVGIGGIGMSGLAEVFHNLGFVVTGSDIAINDNIGRLKSLGISIEIGHRAENVIDKDVVIYSSSISGDNPEIVNARRLKIPVIRRADLLAELVRMKYSILVSGAHGKTTTTSLISTLLIDAGLNPTVIIGGRLKRFNTNAILGRGEYLVAEADESDGSFLSLLPTIAVVTNIDREHMDFYQNFDAIKKAFIDFANKVPFYGFVLACVENEGVREILPELKGRVITYGFSEGADYRGVNVELGKDSISFELLKNGEYAGKYRTNLRGRHNVLNSIATIAAGDELMIPLDKISDSLSNFKGIGRRFEIKGEKNGILVIDDYGHHPTEIKATLDTVRLLKRRRVFVVFQPHRYTRTFFLFDEFVKLFADVQDLILMEIYSAQERPIEGVNSEALLFAIRNAGNSSARLYKDSSEILGYLRENAREGDVIITIGAGSVYKIGEEFLGQ